jgi:tryptophanyl-tRNA synthetase
VRKYAFSGAPSSLAEHREKGANTDVDVAYQYLTFFLEDDEELAHIQREYSQGRMTTGDVKERLIVALQQLVHNHQVTRAKITQDELRYFMSTDKFTKAAN